MFLLVAFTFLGIALGVFTGLIPGLHVNTVAVSILSMGALKLADPYAIAALVIAMAITHTVFDFVPSIVLGMPEPGTALSVLPGHRLLMEGRGVEAIYLTALGGVVSVLLSVILLPVLIIVIPTFYQNIQTHIHWLLLIVAFAIILSEAGTRKAHAFVCFMLAGALGFLVLNTFILPSHLLFFPLFTGLFGLPTLLISLNNKTSMPKQDLGFPKIKKRLALMGTAKALFSGMLVGTLPGVGASQATVLTKQITRKDDHREFLISMGGINTIVALFSLVSLFTISRPRSGAAVVVQQVLAGFGTNELFMLAAIALMSTGISALLLMKTTKKLVYSLQRVNYSALTIGIMIFLLAVTIIFTGPVGVTVLFTATSIGLLAPLFGVKRSNLMGALMLPLIIFYAQI